jgi:centriolar protein POC1
MSEIIEFSKKTAFEGHSGAVYSLQYDGKFIYSASADKYVVRWNVESGEQDKFAIKLPATPYSILLIDKYSKLVTGLSNGDVHIFDLQERKEIKFYKLHKKGVYAMAENSEKSQFYLADGEGTLSVWNTQTLELLIQLPFDCGKIRRIIVSKDGKLIYLCCQDGKVRCIETLHFNLIQDFHAHTDGVGTLLEWSEDVLITAGKDAHIKWWDKPSATCFKSIPAHNYMIYDLIRLNENTLLSASRDKTIKIWDTEQFQVVQRLDLKKGGHRHSVNCIIKLDDETFASSSDDSKVIVWGK